MTEQELRRLIGDVVRDLLAGTAVPSRAGRTGLVLFSGGLLGFDSALDSLTRLRGALTLDWTQTASAERILDQERITATGMTPAAQSLVATHDLLIIPTLTVNLAAKLAHGVSDCLASNVASEFIMSNKPVVTAVNAACPDHADKRGWFPDIPAGYAAMLRGNLDALKSFGVHLTSAEKLDQAVLRAIGAERTASRADTHDSDLKLVSEASLAPLADGSVLRIGPRTPVTALAREAAAARNILIERRN